ncbi:MAG: SGNH/GDSL hydrolase family protein [Pseudomonadota bacterium]
MADGGKIKNAKRRSHDVRFLFIFLVIVLTGIIIEGGSRLAFVFRDEIKTFLNLAATPDLNEYEMPDPKHPSLSWVLRPGISRTLEQTVNAKEYSGRFLAVKHLTDRASQLNFNQDEIIYQINSDGFKGPEIDKTHSQPRILTIGDSCTFRSLFDKYSYPRALERELRNRGKRIEVVNAGVEGYRPKDVLLNIEKMKELRPEITTIYLGWNSIWEEGPAGGIESYLASFRLARSAFMRLANLVIGMRKIESQGWLRRAMAPDKNAPQVHSAEGYNPKFLKDIAKIIDEMQSVGSKVVIITIPSLYIMEEEPSERAFKVGFLPPYTNNPYVLAKLIEQYNFDLRRLAKQRGLQVIDLEKWGKKIMRPRDIFFDDTSHPTEETSELIGKHIAEELLPSVELAQHMRNLK